MNDSKMNKQLGTKWFTFYTKVRPWLGCISAIMVFADFVEYSDVYANYWWMMLYLLSTLSMAVLCILVFVKSLSDYERFVNFVNGVLIFETINLAYGQAVQQYIQNAFNISIAIITGGIILLIGYFLWYRLNIKYFRRRINIVTNGCVQSDSVCQNNDVTRKNDKVIFCRKCGERLADDAIFCSRCGTKVASNEQDGSEG